MGLREAITANLLEATLALALIMALEVAPARANSLITRAHSLEQS